MSKVTPFLMFNDQLEAAIAFYSATFPDSSIQNIARTGTDGPITSAEFVGRSTRERVQSGMTIGDADTFFFYLPPFAFHALYSSGIHLAQGR